MAGRARRGVRFRLFLILSLIGLREADSAVALARSAGHLPARDCAPGVFRLCAKPDGLAQIQASSGSGPSESEGALAVLTAPRRNAGIRQPSASQK